MILKRASDGSQVRLGRELGRGGEGAVHEITGTQLVAKVYARPPTATKIEKLRAMTRRNTPALLRIAAWPVDLLEDHASRVCGFLMPRVAGRHDVHQLYSPKSRRREFPHADARFLVRAAANLARAFASMHEAGHVIGDVNHGNALVGADGTVMLIDCDSFQVRDSAGRIFTCDVGVPLFTAPELQGKAFRGMRRSRQHDDFGLAVLLFHLLFQGRHPYAGRYVAGEMPVERAIAESRFVYGARAAAQGMTAPPASLPLDALGPAIANLFERAFAEGPDLRRPQAAEWVEALAVLERELEPCTRSNTHFHPPGPDCCWCALEKSGIRLFGSRLAAKLSRDMLESLWNAVQQVPHPTKDLEISRLPSMTPVVQELPAKPEEKSDDFFQIPMLAGMVSAILAGFLGVTDPPLLLLCGGIGASMAALAFWRWRHPRKPAGDPADKLITEARLQWRAMLNRWNAQCSPAPFRKELSRLSKVRQQLEDWEKLRRKVIRAARLEQESRERQKQLATFRIDEAGLGLSLADIAALASMGIQTAADVVRENMRVQQHQITAWAADLNRQFRVKRTAPLDEDVSAEVERRLAERQQELLRALQEGPALLEQKRAEIEVARDSLRPALKAARKALEEAASGG